MNVDCNQNVLVVAVAKSNNTASSISREAKMAVINSPEYESCSNIQSGTLMHLSRQLSHSCFDTIIKMAKDPASAIRLNDMVSFGSGCTTHVNAKKKVTWRALIGKSDVSKGYKVYIFQGQGGCSNTICV